MKTTTIILILASLILSACSIVINPPRIMQGSGILASEKRAVNDFTSVELAGSGTITVKIGEIESVTVETDDNLLQYIETKVSGGKLVIGTRTNTNLTTQLGVKVAVTMKSMKAVKLIGSGDITITGLNADSLVIELLGSGTIKAAGKAQNLTANLFGSGNIFCGELPAGSVEVDLPGSGNVQVNASNSLAAKITGSGNIFYRGNPSRVEKSIPGSGNIAPLN